MVIRPLLGALVLLLLAAPLRAEAPMKRLTLRQDLLGWEAVGRVEIGRTGYCTGVLIAPDLVLTAAHCLLGGRDGYVEASQLRFRAGLRDGVALAESGVQRMLVHPSYDPQGADRARQIRWDVGLIQLSNPVSVTTAAPFRTAALGDGARGLSVVSYGHGRRRGLVLGRGLQRGRASRRTDRLRLRRDLRIVGRAGLSPHGRSGGSGVACVRRRSGWRETAGLWDGAAGGGCRSEGGAATGRGRGQRRAGFGRCAHRPSLSGVRRGDKRRGEVSQAVTRCCPTS